VKEKPEEQELFSALVSWQVSLLTVVEETYPMSLEQQGYNDGASNKGMTINSKWSVVEKQKYVSAYLNGKKKSAA
jgi:hypothetical protein